MATSNSGPISAESRAALREAIRLVFARWTALQVAVDNQWGGRDSRAKADQFGESILSWFCGSSGPHYFEDLVDMMEGKISESFSADLDDDSVQDVAEHLLFIHEQCLQNNYSYIEKLKGSHVQGNDVSQSRQECIAIAFLNHVCPRAVVQIVAVDNDDDTDETWMMNDEVATADETTVDSNPFPRSRRRGPQG